MNLLLTFNYKKLSIGKSVGVGFATVGLAERFFVSFSNYSLTKIHIRTTHTSHILGNGSKILIPSSNVLNPLFKSSSHTVLGGVPAIRDLRCMTRRMNYPYSSPDTPFMRRILGYPKKDVENEVENNTPQLPWNQEIEKSLEGTISSRYAQIPDTTVEKKEFPLTSNSHIRFIKSCILNKGKITTFYLKKVLKELNQAKDLTTEEQEILFSLREYFLLYHPTIEIAEIFLHIWAKNDYKVVPLRFIPKEITEVKNQQLEINVLTSESQDKKSYEEKKNECLTKISEITLKMNNLFLKYEHQPNKMLDYANIKEWYDFLENRGNVLPLQPEEILINKKLKILYKKYAPNREDLLSKKKDNMKIFKKQSTLPENLKQEVSEQSFTLKDYALEITRIKSALQYIENNKTLSVANLKLLAINSFAASIDDEGTFKLTQEAYKFIANNAKLLGLNFFDSYPQTEHILSKIKNKEYVVIDQKTSLPGTVVDIAHVSHKALLVYDNIQGKNVLIRIGMLTSTRDNTSMLIDKYQQTNPDPDKQQKYQMFRIFPNFIIVEDTEPLTVDIEATLLFKNNNSMGESITQILYDGYNSKRGKWSTNPYQYSYKADEEFLRNLIEISYKRQLECCTENFEKLNTELDKLKNENQGLYENKLAKLEKSKENYQEYKKDQQYFSLLPENLKLLYKVLNLFDAKIEKNKQQQNKKQLKADANAVVVEKKSEENHDQPKSAKEKKEEYLKNKQIEINNYEKNI